MPKFDNEPAFQIIILILKNIFLKIYFLLMKIFMFKRFYFMKTLILN